MMNNLPTFKLNNPLFLERIDMAYDAYSVLYFNHWSLFTANGEGIDANFLSRERFTLTADENVMKGGWKVLPDAQVVLTFNTVIYMTRVCYYDRALLLLEVDGTQEYIILYQPSVAGEVEFHSLEDVNTYLDVRLGLTKEQLLELEKSKNASEADIVDDVVGQWADDAENSAEYDAYTEAVVEEQPKVANKPTHSAKRRKKEEFNIFMLLGSIIAVIILFAAVTAALSVGWEVSGLCFSVFGLGILGIGYLGDKFNMVKLSLILIILWGGCFLWLILKTAYEVVFLRVD